MVLSLLISLLGSLILLYDHSYTSSVIAYIILGIGFAAGFPLMLGYAGHLFPNLAGTAFSIVLVIALLGNTIVNYLFGIIAQDYGIHLLLVACGNCNMQDYYSIAPAKKITSEM